MKSIKSKKHTDAMQRNPESVQNDEESKKNDFLEKVIKYLKTDDLVRKERLEYRDRMQTLNEIKGDLESYILRYLDNIQEEQLEIKDNCKLTKYESIRKGTLKKDIIKQSICEQLQKEHLVKNEQEGIALAELTCQAMENKREVKHKICLRRTIKRKK